MYGHIFLKIINDKDRLVRFDYNISKHHSLSSKTQIICLFVFSGLVQNLEFTYTTLLL